VPRVKPRARAEVAVAEIDGEAVVWDPVPEKLNYLNHSAALVFALCDGKTTIAEMAEAIGDAYEMDPQEVDGQIRPLLRQLGDAGLMEGKAAERIGLEAGKRRAALKKLRRIPVPKDT
jgi:hypothetical protein